MYSIYIVYIGFSLVLARLETEKFETEHQQLLISLLHLWLKALLKERDEVNP